jgi:hypothetical protein
MEATPRCVGGQGTVYGGTPLGWEFRAGEPMAEAAARGAEALDDLNVRLLGADTVAAFTTLHVAPPLVSSATGACPTLRRVAQQTRRAASFATPAPGSITPANETPTADVQVAMSCPWGDRRDAGGAAAE